MDVPLTGSNIDSVLWIRVASLDVFCRDIRKAVCYIDHYLPQKTERQETYAYIYCDGLEAD